MDKKSKIKEYINDKKDIYELLLSYMQDNDTLDFDFTKINRFFKSEDNSVNCSELEQFLQLIIDISDNYHRTDYFSCKINKLLQYLSDLIKQTFSNFEIFNIFRSSKIILLFLFKNKIITIDDDICREIYGIIDMDGTRYRQYFLPEIKSFISEQQIQNIEDELLLENPNIFIDFDEKRQKGENDSYICSLIRQDSVEEFVAYINSKNIPLSGEIKTSIFETNSFLIEMKNVTLIEYTTFFGSIKIFIYLKENSVELTPSLWLFAIHSRNAELIQLLSDYKVNFPIKRCEKCFMESIKCHHNEFAEYFKNYEFDPKLNDEIISCILQFHNYSFFPSDFNESNEFFYLCYYKYTQLVDLFMEKKEKDINDYIMQAGNDAIKKAAEDDKTEVIYYLLSKCTCIKNSLFSNIKGLTRIAIPPSITSIEENSFGECSRMKLISIPSSVTSIGGYAFAKCHSLKELTIPSHLSKINAFTFCNCVGLKKVSIPSSVTFILGFAFESCQSVEHISVFTNVNKMASNVFDCCVSLLYIDIPPLKQIPSRAYMACQSLVKISIPSSVQLICPFAFFHCLSLKQVLFEKPSSVTQIDNNAFDSCLALEQITIPSSVSSIRNGAFHQCISLKQISFESPSSLISIGNAAFELCSSLINITIPSSVTSIGRYLFERCTSLKKVLIPLSISQQNLGVNDDVEIIKI